MEKIGEFELNKVYCMDCLEGLKKIPDNSIDLIITDPPYLIDYKTNHRKNKNHLFCKPIKNDDNPELIVNFIKESFRVLKDNSAMYIFCSFDKVDFFKINLEKYYKVKNIIIWVKNNWTAGDLYAQFGKKYEMIILVNKGRKRFNGKRLNDVWFFNRISGKKQIHQNEKPVQLFKLMIEKHSKEEDIIMDAFVGGGSSMVACKQLKRKFIGFEINKEYVDIANKRLQQEALI